MMKLQFYIILLIIITLTGCGKQKHAVPDAQPAVYYWRTTLQLDSTERAFLHEHHVGKLYTRFFDVVMRDGKPMPNATLRFLDTVPAGVEVIPVIFIMENCLRHGLDEYAQQLVTRVLQMCETNDLPAPRELQIDCDWTLRSKDTYYHFLQLVQEHTAQHGMRLSATIRLHQLAMDAPPVDYGVLMVYNTGDVNRTAGRNPILDYRDVQPYLKYVARYRLPLCAAYPTYGWQLLYDSNGFKAILHDENLSDSTLYQPLPANPLTQSLPGVPTHATWLVVASRDLPELSDDASNATWISPGDTVHTWTVAPAELLRVSRALQHERNSINDQVIIYALDTKNINRYNSQDYETFYHP